MPRLQCMRDKRVMNMRIKITRNMQHFVPIRMNMQLSQHHQATTSSKAVYDVIIIRGASTIKDQK